MVVTKVQVSSLNVWFAVLLVWRLLHSGHIPLPLDDAQQVRLVIGQVISTWCSNEATKKTITVTTTNQTTRHPSGRAKQVHLQVDLSGRPDSREDELCRFVLIMHPIEEVSMSACLWVYSAKVYSARLSGQHHLAAWCPTRERKTDHTHLLLATRSQLTGSRQVHLLTCAYW